jgi:hypothetical protein
MNKTTLSFAALALVSLGGCSTPQPVLDFAARGAALTDQADRETRAFLARAGRAHDSRVEIVKSMAERDVRLDTTLQFSDWIAKQAGMPDSDATTQLVNALAQRSRESREDTEARLGELRKKFDSKAPAMDETSQALANTKKSFVVLANEMTPREWADFGWKYLNQVRDAYRDSQKTASE